MCDQEAATRSIEGESDGAKNRLHEVCDPCYARLQRNVTVAVHHYPKVMVPGPEDQEHGMSGTCVGKSSAKLG